MNDQERERKALFRIPHPIEAPTHCRYCGSPVAFCSNSELYGKEYGGWPYGYYCGFCTAYVGCHPSTRVPLGTMATAALRKKRAAAHNAFDPLWRSKVMSRTKAYSRLAHEMGIRRQDCHIALFEAEDCDKAIAVAERLKKELKL